VETLAQELVHQDLEDQDS